MDSTREKERRVGVEALLKGIESGMGSGVINALRSAKDALNAILAKQVELPPGVSPEAWNVIKLQIGEHFHDACRRLEEPILMGRKKTPIN